MMLNDIIKGLEKNKKVFEALLDVPHDDLIRFKPKEDSWCFLEIVCHLIDEEVEDFRARVNHTLVSLESPFKSISPRTWPYDRKYLNQDFNVKSNEFLQEREKSIHWLKNLPASNWNQEFIHPDLGKISAKRFLHNWLAHDYLHIRQLNALKYAFLEKRTGQDLTYAGNW